jgi:hypothetical protein
MKRSLTLLALALAPLCTGCVFAAAVGAGYIVSQQVLPNNIHIAEVRIDVDAVWPSVKQTVSFYQEPGSEMAVQDFPRTVNARVDGSKVTVEVEAIDLDRTTIRVSAEKYLGNDNATAAQIMRGILDRLDEYEDQY